MLLRSSSTPILGSLLSSISECPNNNSLNSCHHHHAYEASPTMKQRPPTSSPHSKLSFQISPGSLHRTSVSCSSSPASGFSDHRGFRRAQSEGSLRGFVHDSSNEEFCSSDHPKKLSGRNKCLMLQTIPSFSFLNSGARCEEEDDESDMAEDAEERGDCEEQGELESLVRDRGNSRRVMAVSGHHEANSNMVLIGGEVKSLDRIGDFDEEKGSQLASREMLLAIGLGIDGGSCGGGGGRKGGGGGGGSSDFNHASGGDQGENHGVEEHYKKMVEENPGNALFLRNYARYLYESKRELPRAEEYYSRAILADPKDGEILSQYAKLLWELHGDEERAVSYHERAVQASPQDSHVHAAYASFLWETEEDDDECNEPTVPQLQEVAVGSA